MKTRKKWLRKTTAICTAALLGTAAIPSTAFAADSYASIEKDAWAKKVTEMASSYATSIEESQSLMSGMQSDMILKFEDSGRSLLGFVAPLMSPGWTMSHFPMISLLQKEKKVF